MHQVGIEPVTECDAGDGCPRLGALFDDLALESLGKCTALSRHETLQKVA